MRENHCYMTSHIEKSLTSELNIHASPSIVWDHITNVQIEKFSDPWLFKLLNIPKPLKAEITKEGRGGKRIAYFKGGKKFLQEILIWEPLKTYSFTFNPEKGFKVGYVFDISDGVFRLLSGSYHLALTHQDTRLQLTTTYSLDKRVFWLFNWPVKIVLSIFQNYLLTSIKKNAEYESHQV